MVKYIIMATLTAAFIKIVGLWRCSKGLMAGTGEPTAPFVSRALAKIIVRY